MQCKNRIVDAKFLQFTNEGHILVLVPRGGDLLTVSLKGNSRAMFMPGILVYHIFTHDHRALWEAARFGP